MKISELKQPYRRMAEYLFRKNHIQEFSQGIYNFYKQGSIMDLFCNQIDKGEYPPITDEIKGRFPADFDFSGDEEVSEQIYLDNEGKIICPTGNRLTIVNPNEVYTQLAKEGKFSQLPNTCEFSEPVELEVWDGKDNPLCKFIIGKFKGKFICKHFTDWQFAQLPTQKIDFSEFEKGDIVEVVINSNEKIYGLLSTQNFTEISLTFSYQSDKAKYILKEDIKSITKIK